ncbi:hypothetical protein CPB86DRAFT_812300 [Serendipita vermifera]|nr:hypothetical protein CPB86DRAFT_812300 [Serendipita vermifera]
MGCWDELCLICGLRPGGGPDALFGDLDECVEMILNSLKEQKLKLRLNKKQARAEIRKVLKLFDAEDEDTPTEYEKAIVDGSIPPGPYFPLTSESWDGWAAIAIGVFDEDDDDIEPAKGNMVTTRLVSCPTGYGGSFEGVEGMDEDVTTDASTNSNNFFCLRAPYYYLQAWVDRDSLPPRQTAFPLEPDMSFEGEFYEIINSKPDSRSEGIGTLDYIDYEGINCSLEQFQDCFTGAFFGAYELGSALKRGLRGNDLIPALLRDFNVWQTCPTDRWVKIGTSTQSLSGTQVAQPINTAGPWQNLPTEMALKILSDLSIDEVLSFTTSCRYLYHKFGEPGFLSMLLRAQLRIPLSDVYWFLPVSTVEGEVAKFCEACDESKASDISVVFNPAFPLWDFFRANYASDSMRNRRRFWRISQQFRQEWYKYRIGELKDGNDNDGGSDDDEGEDGSSGDEDSGVNDEDSD